MSVGPKNFAKKAVFLVVAILLPFVVLNEALRWTWYRHTWFNRIMVRDSELIFALRPDFYGRLPFNMSALPPWKGKNAVWELTTNSQGFRRPGPVRPKPDGIFRIICLGDSVTFGLDVDDLYTYPSQLQALLTRSGFRNPEVINAGVVAYSSRQGLVDLDERLLGLKPDLVILNFGFNDAQNTFITAFQPDRKLIPGDVEHGFSKVYDSFPNAIMLFAVHQPLAAVIRGAANAVSMLRFASTLKKIQAAGHAPRFAAAGQSGLARYKDSRVPPDDFRKNLEQCIWLARRNGFRLMFYIPYRIEGAYRSVLLDLARENSIPVVDFSTRLGNYHFDQILQEPAYAALLSDYRRILGDDFFRQNPDYVLTSDSFHPNALANRIIAEEMARAIIANYLQPPAIAPGPNASNPPR